MLLLDLKVKVKLSLSFTKYHAMKLYLLLKYHAMGTHGVVGVLLHAFLTSALDGGEN
jgi:hypothetical protein